MLTEIDLTEIKDEPCHLAFDTKNSRVIIPRRTRGKGAGISDSMSSRTKTARPGRAVRARETFKVPLRDLPSKDVGCVGFEKRAGKVQEDRWLMVNRVDN